MSALPPRRSILFAASITALLHGYIGVRLLPDLPVPMAVASPGRALARHLGPAAAHRAAGTAPDAALGGPGFLARHAGDGILLNATDPDRGARPVPARDAGRGLASARPAARQRGRRGGAGAAGQRDRLFQCARAGPGGRGGCADSQPARGAARLHDRPDQRHPRRPDDQEALTWTASWTA